LLVLKCNFGVITDCRRDCKSSFKVSSLSFLLYVSILFSKLKKRQFSSYVVVAANEYVVFSYSELTEIPSSAQRREDKRKKERNNTNPRIRASRVMWLMKRTMTVLVGTSLHAPPRRFAH